MTSTPSKPQALALPYPLNLAAMLALFKTGSDVVFLDSGNESENQGRFDIFTANPAHTVCVSEDSQNSLSELITQASKEHGYKTTCDSTQANDINNSLPPFCTGWIGYMEYEYGLKLHKLKSHKLNKVGEAKNRELAWAGYYNWSIISDHTLKTCTLYYIEDANKAICDNVEAIKAYFANPSRSALSTPNTSADLVFTPKQTRADYHKQFEQVQAWLKSGDCYQINLTQAFEAKSTKTPNEVYQQLSQNIRTPFGAFIQRDNLAIASFSPEKFLSIDNKGCVTTKPIKGTRKRGENSQQDNALKTELTNSAKDKAENLMIVDLLRNDIGQACEAGSVKVNKLFAIESYSNVHQMVSTISGQLRSDIHPLALLEKAFPGGSITGAPKRRAMEIIHQLEQQPRRLYCGSLFYYSDTGNLDSNICIRTLLFEDDVITCNGGGGIVYDSVEEAEYQESIDKISHFGGVG